MPTSPIKILFKGYLVLNAKEKKQFFKLLQEDIQKERIKRIYKGLEVQYMTEKEEKLLRMVRDLRENAFYYKTN